MIVVGWKNGYISLYNVNNGKEVSRIKTGYVGTLICCVKYLPADDSIIAVVNSYDIKKWKFLDDGLSLVEVGFYKSTNKIIKIILFED